MDQQSPSAVSPHRVFAREDWARLRADTPLTLDEADVERLKSLNDPIVLDEVVQIYLPISRLLSLYVAAIQNTVIELALTIRNKTRPPCSTCTTSGSASVRSLAR